MKKYLNKIIIVALLLTSPLLAKDESIYQFNSYSLVGLELGISEFDVENDATPPLRETYTFNHGGIKIGAQTENYRLFLSGRYFSIDDFDSAYTAGIEAQYLFNFSKYANLYVGVNTGLAEMKFIDATDVTRTVSDSYIGGDIGFNVHFGNSLDLELGARAMSLDATNTKNNITYTFDTIVSGYMSLIFKYQMD